MGISHFLNAFLSSVRNHKLSTALAAGALATGLLLGTSMTQAATVILDGTTVTRIDNLEVFDDQGGAGAPFMTWFLDSQPRVLFTGKTSTASPSMG